MSKIIGWRSPQRHTAEVAPYEFPPISPDPQEARRPTITPEMLDIEVKLSVQIGSCKQPLRELLKLHPGSLVMLDQHEGALAEIQVNGVTVGEGMVVVANERYAIQVTKVGIE